MDNPNLLWLTITYCPEIVFSIEATAKGLRKLLCHDMSHFYYFHESQFGHKNVRGSDFKYCKSLLKSELVDPALIFHVTTGRAYIPILKSYDCNTSQVQSYEVPSL